VKTWDAIVVGAGIIGLSLAIELRKRGLQVLVVEKGEPGREASWAAGGMLADFPLEMPSALQELASASAHMYPEFVHELEDESGLKIDLRDQGTLLIDAELAAERGRGALTTAGGSPAVQSGIADGSPPLHSCALISVQRVREIEPHLQVQVKPVFLKERSVDPRGLTTAAIAAAKHRGVDFSSGDEVTEIEVAEGKVGGVRTNKTRFLTGVVVNCAGAWSGRIGPHLFPTRPVKGQMLCVAMPEKEMIRHVIRAPGAYLIPRSDGRLLIGATQEEAGFDKHTIPETIQKMRRAAIALVPRLADARILEAWAGLRPGTPDNLPILGATATSGYFVATGHFRDGILLAPVTARVMGQVISGEVPDLALDAFSALRFPS
jgi:glycine oxidase